MTGSPSLTAAMPARCTNTGAHEVLYSISLPRSALMLAGTTSQPSRQPVISQDLENVLALIRRSSCSSQISRNEGAMPFVAVDRGARRHRPRKSRCRACGNARGWPLSSSCATVHPVGLLGELRYSALVPGFSASAVVWSGSFQPAAEKSSATVCTVAPRIFGNLLQVGPQRHDLHHAVTRIDEQLRCDHQRVDARAGHGDLFGIDFLVQVPTGTLPASLEAPGCRGCGV